VEYDRAYPVALIEHKRQTAAVVDLLNPSYRAICSLATEANKPFFEVRYARDFSWWVVTPLNHAAHGVLPERTSFTEVGYVKFLYRLRDREVPREVLDAIS